MKKNLLFALLPLLFLTSSLSVNPSLSHVTTRPGVYRAVIAQEATDDPYEAYVFENGLGVTFAFVRDDVGQYKMNASSAVFTATNKVYMSNSLYNEGADVTNLCLIKTRRWDSDTLLISTFIDGAASDDCSFFFEVLVYP